MRQGLFKIRVLARCNASLTHFTECMCLLLCCFKAGSTHQKVVARVSIQFVLAAADAEQLQISRERMYMSRKGCLKG